MWSQVEQSLLESMQRAFESIATLLPGIIACVLAILIFVLLAWGAAWLTRLILEAVNFDARMSRGTVTLAEWTPAYTPTQWVMRLVFWIIVIFGLLVGISALNAGSYGSPISQSLLGYVPHVIGAVLLLLAGNVVARFLSRSVLLAAVNMNLGYARLLSMGVKWLVLVLTGAMVLDHLDLGQQIVNLAFGILFGGIVLALSLAVGLGSRDLVSRSLEREAAKPAAEPPQSEKLHHF